MAKTTTKPTTKPTATKKTTTPKVNPVDIYVQPPFDSRIKNTLSKPFRGGAGSAGIRRGFMVWDSTIPAPSGYSPKDPNYPAHVSFLFNPSTISTSYQIAEGGAQAAMNYGATQGIAGGLLLPLQQQTSFTIMFDRTYELNTANTSADIQNFGCDVDCAAVRQYTGMYAGIYSNNANYIPFNASNTETSTSGKSSSNVNQSLGNWNSPLGNLSQGIMQLTIGYVYFSGPTSSAVGGNGYGITYYGYIDSWDVEYTHFTQNMIPMRCVVDISFTFLPPPQKPESTAGAAAIATSQQVAGVTPGGTVYTGPGPGGYAGR